MASNSYFQASLGNNALELHFIRRHPKAEWDDSRGLLGTTNFDFLNGDFGKQVLFFQPPKGVGMGYPYKNYNLCVVWDILRQEYRVFGAEQVSVTRQWDLTTPEGVEEFQTYFTDKILTMSTTEKNKFMGYIGPAGTVAFTAPKPTKPSTKPNKSGAKSPSVKDRFKGFFQRVGKWFESHKK